VTIKPDRLSVASVASLRKKVVSPAHTRSLNDELPMLMLGLTVIWFSIQSIATQKSAGARMQPWRTPDVISRHADCRFVFFRHVLLLQYFHEEQLVNP